MTKSVYISFFLYKSRMDGNGCCPLYCRVTINKERYQFSIGKRIEEQDWCQAKQIAVKPSREAREINSKVNSTRTGINKLIANIEFQEREMSIRSLKDELLEKPKVTGLIQVFEMHNEEVGNLIGIRYSDFTFKIYDILKRHVIDFLNHENSQKEILLEKLDLNFIRDFELYLIRIKGHNQNTVNKLLQRLKKVARYAVQHRLLVSFRFEGHKLATYRKELVYLNAEELERITSVELSESLSRVRDCFVFSCYTGLAYAEMKVVCEQDLFKGIDGNQWLKVNRKKTNGFYQVILLPQAVEVLRRYDFLLPSLSNQKMNANLKKIVKQARIDKVVTTHVARKTYATTVLLNNKVSLEVVSKLLGHSKVRTTQEYYAEILSSTITKELSHLL